MNIKKHFLNGVTQELAAVYKKSAKEYPKLNDQGELDPITDN